MNRRRHALSVYLNDHLAASVAALNLLDHLTDLPEEEGGPADRAVLTGIRGEIAEERETLREVMRRLEIRKGVLRRAAAWAGEKAARVKLSLGGNGKVAGLQAAEALFLGVTGKSALWRTLAAVAEEDARLEGIDWNSLQTRARAHCETMETLRMAAAKRALEP